MFKWRRVWPPLYAVAKIIESPLIYGSGGLSDGYPLKNPSNACLSYLGNAWPPFVSDPTKYVM